MVITDPAHPLAAGLSGTINFLQSAKGISYITSDELGTATPALVAETTTAGQYTLIGYTSGQTLADGNTAPEARVGLSGLHNQNANPTTDGWAILDATINWTTGNNGGGGTTIVESITVAHAFAGQNIGVPGDGVYQASLADHLGSATTSRQTDGVTVTQRYTPYGATRGGGGGNQMPADLTFTGQTDDPGTGLIEYNARAYDPQIGRFIMADPVLDGLNRYTYVRNNPVNAIDPTGNSDCPPADVGCNSRNKADEFEGKQDLAVFNSCFQEGSLASCGKLQQDFRDQVWTSSGWAISCMIVGLWQCTGMAAGGVGWGRAEEITSETTEYSADWSSLPPRYNRNPASEKERQDRRNYREALRHLLWLARLTQELGPDDAFQFALGHESGFQPDDADSNRDISLTTMLGLQSGLRLAQMPQLMRSSML